MLWQGSNKTAPIQDVPPRRNPRETKPSEMPSSRHPNPPTDRPPSTKRCLKPSKPPPRPSKKGKHTHTHTHTRDKQTRQDKERDQKKGGHPRCQEIGIILARDLPGKVLGRELEPIPLGRLGRKLSRACREELQVISLVHALPLRRDDAVAGPLPELAAGDFGGGGVLPFSWVSFKVVREGGGKGGRGAWGGRGLEVFGKGLILCRSLRGALQNKNSHQVVDRNTSDAPNPGLHVPQSNVEVLADSLLGDLARDVHVEEVVGGDVHVLAADEELVGRGHVLVEDFGRDAGESGMSNPGSGPKSVTPAIPFWLFDSHPSPSEPSGSHSFSESTHHGGKKRNTKNNK